MNRCPICKSVRFEVVMFHGKYYTSCCEEELKMDEEQGDEQ